MKNEETYATLLRRRGVKVTANRLVIVRELARQTNPVTMAELERSLNTIDKSTIFRILQLFKQRGVVHAIVGVDESTHYELCHSEEADNDKDQHPHFYCEQCHKTFCLDYMVVPKVPLPRGFKRHSVNFIIKGICDVCMMKADPYAPSVEGGDETHETRGEK
ncbi:MAG: transcriptional repressor [Prevotella sp.]|nr:transcriptional repressor [Prevotella sp.]